jgi:hypothetical protein
MEEERATQSKVYLCNKRFVGTDGGTYTCAFRYGTVKKVFGHIYAPMAVKHDHINKDGVKEQNVSQRVL